MPAWNGGSIFTYYYTQVFTNAGITDTHTQFGIAAIQNASWCVGGIFGGYLLDYWGRRTSYLIGTGQACLCLLIQGGITLGIFDKGIENKAAGAGFVTVYIVQWFLWIMFFSPGACIVTTHEAALTASGQHATGRDILCGTTTPRLCYRQRFLDGRGICDAVFRPANVSQDARLGLDLLRVLHGIRIHRDIPHISRDERGMC